MAERDIEIFNFFGEATSVARENRTRSRLASLVSGGTGIRGFAFFMAQNNGVCQLMSDYGFDSQAK